MNQEPNNPFEKIVNEFFATNSFANPRNASSWETNMIRWPHGATTNSGTYEKNFYNRAKEEEENAKGKPIKPWPLDFIGDNIIKTYENLITLKNTLKASLRYPDMSNSQKQIIKNEIQKINEVIDIIKEMFYNIEKITL